MLSKTFASHAQSDVTISAYDSIARGVIRETEQFDPFLGISSKRRHYRKLVRSFSVDKRLK